MRDTRTFEIGEAAAISDKAGIIFEQCSKNAKQAELTAIYFHRIAHFIEVSLKFLTFFGFV